MVVGPRRPKVLHQESLRVRGFCKVCQSVRERTTPKILHVSIYHHLLPKIGIRTHHL